MQAAKARQELDRRMNVVAERVAEMFEPEREVRDPINLEFITNHYLRLMDEAFRAGNLLIAQKVLESLERLHFGKETPKAVISPSKRKSKSNAPTN